ncbi:hypothetical protein KAR91_65270 [Candidatus Pacearchaeota archaeon]|nr:hypothetical protein [Candidatus Pacearchaeota archaeon]
MDILGSLAGGAITGLVGPIISAIGNYKMKKLELDGKKSDQAHDLLMVTAESEAMLAETQAKIEVQKEATRGEVEKAELSAFSKSLEELKVKHFKESYMDRLEKAGPLGRFAVIVVALALAGIDVLKGTMRPVLTYYLIGATTWVTYMAYEIMQRVSTELITQDWAQGMFEKVTLTVVYLTVTCVTWWFCDRRMAKFLAKNLNQGGTK